MVLVTFVSEGTTCFCTLADRLIVLSQATMTADSDEKSDALDHEEAEINDGGLDPDRHMEEKRLPDGQGWWVFWKGAG